MRRRISIRFFRWAAVLLATLGLALLYLMASMREVPRIEIGAISTMMNFAYINVAGVVARDARVYSREGLVSSVGFEVDDGTGRISVRAYGKKAQALLDAGNLPRGGDRVSMDGSLSVSAEDRRIYLQVPESLKILEREAAVAVAPDALAGRKIAEVVAVAELAPDDEGRLVVVEGRLGRPVSIKGGAFYQLSGETGKVKVVLWDSRMGGRGREGIVEGARVAVTGLVNMFRGEVEVVPRGAYDIRALAPADGGRGE